MTADEYLHEKTSVQFILIFLGGGLGSVARYLLGRWVNTWHNYQFPVGTLAVNVIACLVLGMMVGVADHRQLMSPSSRLFWTVGFCGGFSTFSTFSHETLVLIQSGLITSSLLYVVLSVSVCLGAVFLGLYLGRQF